MHAFIIMMNVSSISGSVRVEFVHAYVPMGPAYNMYICIRLPGHVMYGGTL